MGSRKKASVAIKMFIDSFHDRNQIEEWVWEYLSDYDTERRLHIRHEIFSELVYPVLKYGFDNNNFKCTYWLYMLIHNLYKNRTLHELSGYLTETQVLEKCYRLNSTDNHIRSLLLKSLVGFLEYSIHEWPFGIIFGNNGATISECRIIRKDVRRVRELDYDNIYKAFIEDYEVKLSEYENRVYPNKQSE